MPNNANDDMDIFIIARVVDASGGGGQWWANSGLYDSEQGGGTQDFGISVQDNGQLGFGFGPGAAGGDNTAKTPGSVLGVDSIFNLTREAVAADLRQVRVNNELLVDTDTGNRRNTRNAIRRTIGSIQTNGNYMPELWYGGMYVFNRILTSGEREAMHAFASDLWSIALV